MAGYRITQERKAAGLCVKCGRPRGEKGTKTRCQVCTAEHNRREAARIARVRRIRRKRNQCVECGENLPLRRRGKRYKYGLCEYHQQEKKKRDSRLYWVKHSPA